MEETIINEKLLLERARSGDLGSFSALVQAYQQRAIHTVYTIVGNYEDARDIAQESFVKAYKQFQSFREESRFYTWLYRILVNTSKDFLRKKKWGQAVSFWIGSQDEGDGETDPVARVESTARTAPEVLMDRELGARIFEALEKLPFRQRSVFSLRYLEGLSIEEIAESLAVSAGAVKANLWQAGEKMRKCLKGEKP